MKRRYLSFALIGLACMLALATTVREAKAFSGVNRCLGQEKPCILPNGDKYFTCYLSPGKSCPDPDGNCRTVDGGHYKEHIYDCDGFTSLKQRRAQLTMAAALTNTGQGPGTKRGQQTTREWLSMGLSLLLLVGGLLVIAWLSAGWLFKSRRTRTPHTLTGWMQNPLAIPISLALFFVVFIAGASGEVGLGRTTLSAAQFSAEAVGFNQAVAVSGTGNTLIGGIGFDNQGNRYVAGGFSGSLTFDTTPPTTLTSTADYDVFIAKYNSSGRALWARVANGPANIAAGLSMDGALAAAVDAQGNAYVGGGFIGKLAFKDAAGNQVAMLSDADNNINFEPFLAKYDTNGNLVWAKGGNSGAAGNQSGEPNLESGINGVTEIVVDNNGTPYVGGLFSGSNFLGLATSPAGGSDAVLAKINPATGEPQSGVTPGSQEFDSTTGLAVDKTGNLYLMGEMVSTMTFPTQPVPTVLENLQEAPDMYIAKYNASGQALWARKIGGQEYLTGNHLAVNDAGDVYVTGTFNGSISFDSQNLTNPADMVSGFLTKYDANGNVVWVRILGGVHYATGDRVAVDAAGNPYIFGTFAGPATFGAEDAATAASIGSPDSEGRYIAMYDGSGAFKSVKPLLSTGLSTVATVGNTPTVDMIFNLTRLVYNPQNGDIYAAADFSGSLMLDNLTLNAPGAQRAGFVATFGAPKPDTIAPTVNIITPDGSKLKHNKPYTIQWQSSDNIGVVSQDVLLTLDNGANFISLATNLAGNVQSFVFTPSDTQTGKGIIRVIARDAAGNAGQMDSPKFKIK
ncbi:MAG TPA: hypothetical protein VKA60_27485 [Blastocatellia bacterium]|nr:hypothetical protein [Blastocatellia bacterium]